MKKKPRSKKSRDTVTLNEKAVKEVEGEGEGMVGGDVSWNGEGDS
jgi:hypothetical protein